MLCKQPSGCLELGQIGKRQIRLLEDIQLGFINGMVTNVLEFDELQYL